MSILDEYEIRNAKESDYNKLHILFDKVFGSAMCDESAYTPIVGRYKVAVDKFGNIVSATGIIPSTMSELDGYEVTWTATLPEHRHKGLIRHMLAKSIKDWTNSNIPIYCFCWRLADKDKINLYSVMTSLGFKELAVNTKHFLKPYYSCCKTCHNTKETCHCYIDLWVLNRH